MKNLIYLVLLLTGIVAKAQFPPPAGQEGSTAISGSSGSFVAWAKSCTITRGLMDISHPDSGYASVGEPSLATGEVGDGIVSLGDAGEAILQFDLPIVNGPGFDFAIFENSFSDDFLELAFVEVSSNGTDFFRFPATSLTPTDEQTGSFGLTDATEINNLAGKYRAMYGTPFDLNELSGISGLNINNITHVKIVDVVGTINPNFARYDSENRIVNDPWPTAYASGGFDLDAVGVIHNTAHTSIAGHSAQSPKLFGNPLSENSFLKLDLPNESTEIKVFDLSGRQLIKFETTQSAVISLKELTALSPGNYLLSWKNKHSWGQTQFSR